MTKKKTDIDAARMNDKIAKALQELEKFKNWQSNNRDNLAEKIVIAGLTRDILCSTEPELDRLTKSLENRNQQALFEKLAT